MSRTAIAEDFGLEPEFKPCPTCGMIYRSEMLCNSFGCKACFVTWYDSGETRRREVGKLVREARRNCKYPFDDPKSSLLAGYISPGRLPPPLRANG